MVGLKVAAATTLLVSVANGFVVPAPRGIGSTLAFDKRIRHGPSSSSQLLAYQDETYPSDYDTSDLQGAKTVEVDKNEGDASIRDQLKRELLLLASVTNRGLFATKDETNVLEDLVAQLEGLNPTPDPASSCEGEWELCATSVKQLFRPSPFFQALRAAIDNPALAENIFSIYESGLGSSTRLERIRQTITNDTLISEMDLEVILAPNIPLRLVRGSVIVASSLSVVSEDTLEFKIDTIEVKNSNIPLFNAVLDELKPKFPIGNAFSALQTFLPNQVKPVRFRTFYVDEGLSIIRDVDDNIFVFCRR